LPIVFCTARTATVAAMRRDLNAMFKMTGCNLRDMRKMAIGWSRRESSGFSGVWSIERQNFLLRAEIALSYIQVAG
jgi:hypothetical protein